LGIYIERWEGGGERERERGEDGAGKLMRVSPVPKLLKRKQRNMRRWKLNRS
jgi:hypothetical protein